MIEFTVGHSSSLYFKVGDTVKIFPEGEGGNIAIKIASNNNIEVVLFEIKEKISESSFNEEEGKGGRSIKEIVYSIAFVGDQSEEKGVLTLLLLDDGSIMFDLRTPKEPGDGGSKSGSGGNFKN